MLAKVGQNEEKVRFFSGRNWKCHELCWRYYLRLNFSLSTSHSFCSRNYSKSRQRVLDIFRFRWPAKRKKSKPSKSHSFHSAILHTDQTTPSHSLTMAVYIHQPWRSLSNHHGDLYLIYTERRWWKLWKPEAIRWRAEDRPKNRQKETPHLSQPTRSEDRTAYNNTLSIIVNSKQVIHQSEETPWCEGHLKKSAESDVTAVPTDIRNCSFFASVSVCRSIDQKELKRNTL